jgi:hypothetical protein
LKTTASGPVTLEIQRQDGRVLRRYSSADPVPRAPDPPSAPWPVYWYRPAQALSTQAGMHRFLWDVHLQPLGAAVAAGGLGAVPTQLPIQAIPYNSPTAAATPWAAPGTYTLQLTVEGKTYSQPIVVKQDPRVKTPALEMQKVYTLTNATYFGAVDAQSAALELGALRERLAAVSSRAQGATAQALAEFEKRAAALEGTRPSTGGGRGGGRGGRGGRGGAPAADQPTGGPPAGRGAAPASADTLWATVTALSGVMNAMQAADVAPTTNTLNAITTAQTNAARVMARWTALKTVDLPALNVKLKAAGVEELTVK